MKLVVICSNNAYSVTIIYIVNTTQRNKRPDIIEKAVVV